MKRPEAPVRGEPARGVGGRRTVSGRGWVLALGIVAVVHALVAWALFLPAPHSGGDNAAYLTLANSLAEGRGYTEWWDPFTPPHAKYPPAWSLLLAGLMVLGAETWGVFKAAAGVLVGLAAVGVAAWAGLRWAELDAREGRATRHAPLVGAAVALLAVLSAGWSEATRWILSEPLFLVGVFLALLGADRGGLRLRGRPGRGWEGPPGAEPVAGARAGAGAGAGDADGAEARAEGAWLGLAVAGALLALFTRTAGLPLFAGLLLLLAWNARWRLLAGVTVFSALPVGAWVLRGREAGEGAYQDEFWMVNPYRPDLGLIGLPELLGRAGTNLRLYVGEVFGREWWGGFPPEAVATLGVVLVVLALAGWGLRLFRREGGLAELFLPLYGGLILVWPEVWSGDRFVLPLYPLLLLWAAEALRKGLGVAGSRGGPSQAARAQVRGSANATGRRPATAARKPSEPTGPGGPPGGRYAGLVVGALTFVLLAAPALLNVLERAGTAGECRRFTVQVAGGDPFACHGTAFRHFRDAAAWAGANLPDDAVVINRKPRIFFALGGTRGRVFPFEPDAAPLLALAETIGARYLLVDRVDGISAAYLPAIVRSRPGAFCWIREFGEETILLGIRGTEGGASASPVQGEGVLVDCGEGWTRPGPERPVPPFDARVPVVVSPPRRRRR